MNTFTIDATNNITAFASLEEARAAKINNAEYFGSAQELAKLAASWPARRPVEIWNSFAGVAPFTSLKPVKKFPNRKAGVANIWKAVEALSAQVGKQGAGSDRSDAPLQRSYAGRNHEADRLAGPYRAGLCQRDADQEAGVESRVLPFEGTGAHLSHQIG
jgi:hypothetical protein